MKPLIQNSSLEKPCFFLQNWFFFCNPIPSSHVDVKEIICVPFFFFKPLIDLPMLNSSARYINFLHCVDTAKYRNCLNNDVGCFLFSLITEFIIAHNYRVHSEDNSIVEGQKQKTPAKIQYPPSFWHKNKTKWKT